MANNVTGPGSTTATQKGRVAIVGAGPTGLTLALLLARAGICSTLIERNSTPQQHPAACILDTRTMEIFREIGVADAILQRCQDVFERARITWVTSLAGFELGNCSTLPDDLAATVALSPVHATQFPQNRLEPLLWEQVRVTPLITFMPGSTFIGLSQTDDGITCMVSQSGSKMTLEADYLIACDGAASPIRRLLGIASEGRLLQPMIGVYFTADLSALVNHRKSILYWTFNPAALGVLIAHWLPDEWVLFVPYYPPQQTPADFSETRCRQLVTSALGATARDLQIRLVRPWVMEAMLAARYRAGRAFFAGDAAHSFPPTGGLGLNTGVQDVHNLAWKLAAVMSGKAGDPLLDTYEQERRPVARTNLEHSVGNFDKMNELLHVVGLDLADQDRLRAAQSNTLFRSLPNAVQRTLVDAAVRLVHRRLRVLSFENDKGERVRGEFRRRIPGQIAHYRFMGLDLGFTYERGAFLPEDSRKPEGRDPVIDYRPTTWPSARLPHFWVERQGVQLSIHDVLSPSVFTLLTDVTEAASWRSAANRAAGSSSLPLRHFVIGAGRGADLVDRQGLWTKLSEVGPCGAVLVRPDGHVAWRTQFPPTLVEQELTSALKRLASISTTRATGDGTGVMDDHQRRAAQRPRSTVDGNRTVE